MAFHCRADPTFTRDNGSTPVSSPGWASAVPLLLATDLSDGYVLCIDT